VTDVELMALAAEQVRCVSKHDLRSLGYSPAAIRHRVESGWLVPVHDGVFSVGPLLATDHDARRMAATLTTPESVLSRASASDAFGFWPYRSAPGIHTITRPGDGGPELLDGIRVHRSKTLAGETTKLRKIPITTPERTVIDIARGLNDRRIRRVVRDVVRLKLTDPSRLLAAVNRHRNRPGSMRVGLAVVRYAGLPVSRARSDAEAVALEILRDAGVPTPDLNEEIAGEEADLSWPARHEATSATGRHSHPSPTLPPPRAPARARRRRRSRHVSRRGRSARWGPRLGSAPRCAPRGRS